MTDSSPLPVTNTNCISFVCFIILYKRRRSSVFPPKKVPSKSVAKIIFLFILIFQILSEQTCTCIGRYQTSYISIYLNFLVAFLDFTNGLYPYIVLSGRQRYKKNTYFKTISLFIMHFLVILYFY